MGPRPATTTEPGGVAAALGMGTRMSIDAAAEQAEPEHPADHPTAAPAPVRIAIVLQLLESARCVHDLVDALGVTQPLISQHLRVLKAAGVVHGDRQGREVVYSLVDDHLAHIVVDAVAHAEETR